MSKKKINEFDLSSFFSIRVIIVGLGGTGSHLVSSLCQLISSSTQLRKEIGITLIDGDYVEKKNLRNQKFLPEDIGKPKAEVLCERYHDVYPSLDISYVPTYIESRDDLEKIISKRVANRSYQLDILVGCVDNLKARRIMNTYFEKRSTFNELVYIDTGNGIGEVLTGQTVIGRSSMDFSYQEKYEKDEDGLIKGKVIIPSVSAYFPEILDGEDEEAEVSCGEVDDSMVQNLGANIMSAGNVFNILNSILVFKTIPGNMFLFDARKNTLTKAV